MRIYREEAGTTEELGEEPDHQVVVDLSSVIVLYLYMSPHVLLHLPEDDYS